MKVSGDVSGCVSFTLHAAGFSPDTRSRAWSGWVDQAISRLHTNTSKMTVGTDTQVFQTLRQHGIRTATDLLVASEEVAQRKQSGDFLGLLHD